MNNKITESLEKIYSLIPDFECQHCHQCCGPIIWFEPEEILIREYLQKQKIRRFVWTIEEFEQKHMRCPYLGENGCIIYPVRPIVCRLQGNIPELECKSIKNHKMMSKRQLNKIREEFVKIIKKTNSIDTFYSTHKVNFET